MNFSVLRFWVLIQKFFLDHFKKITADTLGWMAAIVLHLSTIPSLLALITGLSDKPPTVDIIMFIYTALILLFAKAIIMRDQLNIITIGSGFIAQSAIMAFILFK
jgi:hypothetical protein